MRINPRSRAKLLASFTAIALAGGLAACGGGGGGGGEDDDEVTIWTSLDQPVIDGIQKQVDILAKEEGITVKIEKVDGIDKVIKTSIASGDTPDIARCPSPAWSPPSWSSEPRSRSTTCSTPTSSRPTWSPGRSMPARWTTSSTGCWCP